MSEKTKVITVEGTDILSGIVVKLVLPLYLFNAIASSDLGIGSREVFYAIFLSAVMYLMCGLVGFVLVPLLRPAVEDKPVYIFELMCGNVTYVGIPACTAALGSTAAFYASLMNIPFSLLCFSVGVFLLSGKLTFRKALNPAFVAGAFAVIVYLFKLPVPKIVIEGAGFVGQIAAPCAMLIIGSVLADLSLNELFSDWRVIIYCVIRLLLLPALTAFFTDLLQVDTVLRGCLILLSAMPAATNTTMLCTIYGGNSRLSAKLISISTILSMITIPLWTFCV